MLISDDDDGYGKFYKNI